MRLRLVLLALALGLGAADARAGSVAEPSPEQIKAWRGRMCTPLGCGPSAGSTAQAALGFGAAALAAGWVGRRRTRSPE